MGGTDILTMKVARAQTLDRWSLSISRNFLAWVNCILQLEVSCMECQGLDIPCAYVDSSIWVLPVSFWEEEAEKLEFLIHIGIYLFVALKTCLIPWRLAHSESRQFPITCGKYFLIALSRTLYSTKGLALCALFCVAQRMHAKWPLGNHKAL